MASHRKVLEALIALIVIALQRLLTWQPRKMPACHVLDLDDLAIPQAVAHMLLYLLRGSLPWSGLEAKTQAGGIW